MSLEDLRTKSVTPHWRNQSLAWFLSRLQLAQAEGQGIVTIRSTMKAVGCPPPRFDASEISVSCVLRAHPRMRKLAVAAPAARKPTTKKRPAPKATAKKKAVPKKKAGAARRG